MQETEKSGAGSRANALAAGWGLDRLADRFGRRETTPCDILASCLHRIERRNGDIGAMQKIDDSARAAAARSTQRWREGTSLSALDGMPIAVKANIAVAGLPWNAGIRAYAERLGTRDADCVASLRAAGAVILGTTSMDEGALGALGDNPWFGRTTNPLRPGHTAGGSSGGSAAAVAAGFCAAALGTDTIGSVRIPAAYCGIYGHKPERGWISNDGVTPLSPTLDTIGVLAGSAQDCLLVTNIMGKGSAGIHSENRPALRRLAILDWSGAVEVIPDVTAAVEHAAEKARRMGLEVITTRLDGFDYARLQRLLLLVAEVEGAAIHERALATSPEGFSPQLRRMLEWGRAQPQQKYDSALAEIRHAGASVADALQGFDALLCPATPQTAFPFGSSTPTDQAIFMTPAICADFPATAFRFGASRDGLPLSLQIVAPDSRACLSLAGLLSEM